MSHRTSARRETAAPSSSSADHASTRSTAPAPTEETPACGTGPLARAGFVARELTDLWRELRRGDRTTKSNDEES